MKELHNNILIIRNQSFQDIAFAYCMLTDMVIEGNKATAYFKNNTLCVKVIADKPINLYNSWCMLLQQGVWKGIK